MFSPKRSQQDATAGGGVSGQMSTAKGSQWPDSSLSGLPSASRGSIPSISLPKGGGSIGGMGEKFDVSAADGTGSITIPVSTSPSRGGLEPSLSLSYNSGNGNGPFGLGWNLGVSSITRKTALGIPQYLDEQESDVFIISGAEDLVPLYRRDDQDEIIVEKETGVPVIHEEMLHNHLIRRYSPRIEGSFLRIERWTKASSPYQVHWRVITPENVTSIYGRDTNSQIYDPCHHSGAQRIFTWLLAEQFDTCGNAIIYRYKEEDSAGVPLAQTNERNRTDETRSSNRYLKYIKYGNKSPNRYLGSWDAFSAFDLPDSDWMFTVAFDYGEYEEECPRFKPESPWACRKDPFSTYRSGFEIRTYRLCRRILMYHHFPAELYVDDYLVSTTNLTYDQQASLTYLKSITHAGCLLQKNGYRTKKLPPVEFQYSSFPSDAELLEIHVQTIDSADLENMPCGVDGSIYQWADLDGEGLPGVLFERSDGWYYKRNLSANNQVSSDAGPATVPAFGPLKGVYPKPPLSQISGKCHFTDVKGDGLLDIMWMGSQAWGYSGRHFDPDLGWAPFREFKSIPNITMDENSRFLDVTGDGLADIVLTQDRAFVWYPSLGEEGYGHASRSVQSLDEEQGPRLVFGDAEQAIYLADMSGDGLSDLVRVRNGDICYWPNTGYGTFKEKVTMDNSPWFDDSDLFNQRCVYISDVDGSGTADILYTGPQGVDLYLNQAGNSFAPRKRLPNFPPVDSVTSVSTVDLLGNGTTCLVWSSILPRNIKTPLKYLDLNRGIKPHLLIGTINNLGAETRIHYAPSTKFYLEDKEAGCPWITRLPFPVQCVEKTEIIDHISHNRFTSHYAYHHGYFDGHEREFRGFAMVEQWDTEDFGVMEVSGGDNIDSRWHVPSVHTKSWFHLGGFLNESVSQLATEYFDVPQHLEGGLTTLLEDSVIPPGLDCNATRESYRALKGYLLREEVYAEDKSPKANIPYTVTESNYAVRMLQPQDVHGHSVFMVVPRESVNFHFERNVVDPRVQHSLVLETDRYGSTLKSLNVAYGRQKTPLPGLDGSIQERLLMTYTENDYTNHIDTLNDYRLPNTFESRVYQIYGFERNRSTRLSMSQFTSNNELASLPEIHYEEKPGTGKQKRMLQKSRVLFRSNDLTGLLPAGMLESLAIGGESYDLAFTPGLFDIFQQGLPDGSTEALLPSTKEVLEDLGRYVELDKDGCWWVPSGRTYFSPEVTTPREELSEARRHFFSARRHTDPFGNLTVGEYDDYDLLHIKTTDAIGNTSQCRNDYRLLQPYLVIDANGNRGACAFDELGCVVATAVMGKESENIGDSLDDFHLTTPEQMEEFFLDPKGPIAKALLGNASTRTVYDDCRFWFEPDVTKKKPNFQATIVRETHASDTVLGELKIQVNFAYTDGFGRTIQSKIQAEPQDGVKTWVGDGWTVFNNKGLPVKKYEPFFDTTHDFVFNQRIGVSPTYIYDPLGRMVSTIHPNHTWTKFIFDNWESKEYDQNDTVLLDPKLDVDVGRFVGLLPEEDYHPTWFEARRSGQLGGAEQTAAEKAAHHADTPTVTHFDPLGRAFLSVVDNGEFGKYSTHVDLDIQGRLLHIIDPKGRRVLDSEFNMIGNALHTVSPEAGERWMFCDVSGAQVLSWDSKMNRIRTEYDVLRRPISSFLQQGSQDEVTVDRIVYGESLNDPEVHNARRQVVKIFDQAGVVANVEYDFKGNLLCTKRQLAEEYKKVLDWDKPVSLEDEYFVTSMAYDALSRSIETIMPDKSVFRWLYNEANLLQRTTVRVRGAETLTSFIDNIDYNARGQRICIKYGNGVVTSYAHDTLTTLLTHLKTRRNPRKFPGDAAKHSTASWPGSQVQNLHYTYDAIGNAIKILDDAQQSIFFRNERVDPSNEYTFDSLYRLIEATGREHLSLAKKPNKPLSSVSESMGHPNDGKEMATYVEKFAYDEVGNFVSVQHHRTGSSHQGWTRNYFYEEASLMEPTKHSNRLSRTSIGSATEHYQYEGLEGQCGNMTSMPNLQVMRWDFRNQLHATSRQVINEGIPETTWYVYDLSGQRVRKVTERQAADSEEPTRLKERIYAGVEIYREYNGRGNVRLERETLHVMDEQTRVALVETRNKGDERHVPEQLIRYQVGNHIGSVTIELSEDGDLISYEEYTPYGNTSYQAARNQTHSPQRYKYTGKERDEENGLDYYGARYYSSDLGRWINCDPSGLEDGLNVYLYVHGNPVNWVDPDGRETRKQMFDRYNSYSDTKKVQEFHKVLWRSRNYFRANNNNPTNNPGNSNAKMFAWSHRYVKWSLKISDLDCLQRFPIFHQERSSY